MSTNELYHHGVKGQQWGVRRYQHEDGTRTSLGKKHELNLLNNVGHAIKSLTGEREKDRKIQSARAQYKETKKALKETKKNKIKKIADEYNSNFDKNGATDKFLRDSKAATQKYKAEMKAAKQKYKAEKRDAWAKQSVVGTVAKGALRGAAAAAVGGAASKYLAKKGKTGAAAAVKAATAGYQLGNAYHTKGQVAGITLARTSQATRHQAGLAKGIASYGVKQVKKKVKGKQYDCLY